jgi:hypothetical protein
VALNAILILKRADVFPSKRKLLIENKHLGNQVVQYSNELNKYKGISPKIDKMVLSGKAEIDKLELEIAGLIKSKKFKNEENKKLALRLDSLQEKYISAIDSLLVERESKRVINQKLEMYEETIASLNKKVGLGSLLISDELKVTPIKQNNRDKKNATALAKKTASFDVCFDLLENKISKPGIRKIYIVITSPDATVIYEGDGDSPKFMHADYQTQAECSKIEEINYKNQKMHFCSSIKPNAPLSTGLYVLEVFSDENKLGMTTFSLK